MITFILAVCGNVDYVYSFPQSPPSRAAWIEIPHPKAGNLTIGSPPSRAAWIEIMFNYILHLSKKSPPSRAAWIEIGVMGFWLSLRAGRRLHGRRGLKWVD